MKASFIHIADIHLGYEQYGEREQMEHLNHRKQKLRISDRRSEPGAVAPLKER